MNYDLKMQEMMEEIPDGERLLLHACCAPCTSGCLEHIANKFKISILFFFLLFNVFSIFFQLFLFFAKNSLL